MTHVYPEHPADSVWGDDQHDMTPVDEEPDDDSGYEDDEYGTVPDEDYDSDEDDR